MRRILIGSVLTVSMLLGGGSAALAAQTETRQFRGDGSSDFGLALYYARADVQRKAEAAGFYDCTEIFKFETYYEATVIWECTR